jgi:hypothetical protein
MTPRDRRRFGAVSALVLGLFAALSLIPGMPTGPAGRGLGTFLWQTLGMGAIGLPLLGFAVGLAGFDRMPLLDMKRSALLVTGLSVLIPFLTAVITDVTEQSFLEPASLSARLSGVVPAFLARSVTSVVGQLGGILTGFLALTGLTLGTIAWHPLQRLERGVPVPNNPRGSAVVTLPDDEEEEEEIADRAPRLVVPSPRKLKPSRTVREPPPRVVPQEIAAQLPVLDLLAPPPPQDTEADAAALDRLGELLLEALRTFKVDGRIVGRTSGPVVTSSKSNRLPASRWAASWPCRTIWRSRCGPRACGWRRFRGKAPWESRFPIPLPGLSPCVSC